MRLDRIQLRGLGPFSEIDVNFAAIEGRVIAVTGGNGEGKTTLLELFGGAIYRRCPTRGKLAELATARDAFVEASIFTDEAWKIRQLIDGTTGKGESVVLDDGGQPAFDSSGVSVYDRWAKKNLPGEAVLYSTIFAAQGSSGFLKMKPADRKAVLLRVLGIEHLEDLAERARGRAKKERDAAAILQARLDDERQRGGDVGVLEVALGAARKRTENAAERVARAEADLTEGQNKVAEAEEILAKATENEARRSELQKKRNDTLGRLKDLRLRLENNREVMSQADEIRSAGERDQVLAKEEADLQDRKRDGDGAAKEAKRSGSYAETRSREAHDRATKAKERVTKAKERLADREKIEAAVARLESVRKTLADDEKALTKVETELEELRGRRIAGAEDRIDSLREGLRSIADDYGEDPRRSNHPRSAEDSLRKDDEVVAETLQLPAILEDAMKRAGGAQISKAAAWKEVMAVEKTADRAHELPQAEADLTHAEEEVAQAEEEVAQALQEKDAATAAAETQAEHLGKLGAELEAIESERKSLLPLTEKADRLTQTETRIEELAPQEETAAAELAAIDQDLEGIPSAKDLPEPISLGGLASELEAAGREEREATAAEAVASKILEDAKAAAERRSGLEIETKAAEERLADWKRVARDLGRDGLQAIEIDAAGPELTGLVNDLLHNCFGTRWTVSIDTTRSSADGKKEIEGLDVMVLDTEKGREGLIETYSGGELVILGEAVSLGLTVLATKRAGITDATLIRDESGAALDPKKGPAYITMLRRAADLTGASKVLFVSHSQELQELADARLNVDGGRVSIS